MKKWEGFFGGIQQDAKLFIYIVVVFCLFRVSFITLLHHYIKNNTTFTDIVMSLFYGLRISLKSAGIVALLAFLFCTIPGIFTSLKTGHLRLVFGYIYIFIITLLFHIKIPYYEEFHIAFSPFLFNTLKDDGNALFLTLVQQYDLSLRLVSAVIISIVLCCIFKKWLNLKTWHMPTFTMRYGNILFRTMMVSSIAIFMVFTRFGGSLTYANSIHWENSALTSDEFLNEAILDDVQAVYRAYAMHKRLQEAQGLQVDEQNIHEYGALVSGKENKTDYIDNYFKRTAKGPAIDKPKHVFLILAESYAGWPLLPEYADLHIADGFKSIIAKDNAVYVPAFLPNGTGTMQAVNGIVSGLAEVNLYANYQAESYKEPYATAIAAQMKKLGYKTYFWYGGFYSWQHIKDFALAQGFDEFYSCGDFDCRPGNAWGLEDRNFFESIAERFDDNCPSFHIILTVSNHPPYTVDLNKEQFTFDKVSQGIPANIKSNKEVITKLGHFWYADKMITEFVEQMSRKYPGSLFMLTGDHADRFNINSNPTMFERYAIPLIIYGNGVHKGILPPKVAGSHLNLGPTLIELIAPRGFTYYAVDQSLTSGSNFGMNHQFYITDELIGDIERQKCEQIIQSVSALDAPDMVQKKKYIDAVRALSWWRIKYGKILQ